MYLETKKAYLLLGSNLGDREAYLQQALELISVQAGTITKQSALYETAAWGNTDQPGFLNLAVEIATELDVLTLLHTVLSIEKALGRVRHEKWGSRLIDIDIILYADEIVHIENELQVPHPEMQRRKFVMQPLVEIAPAVIHPVFKKSMAEILAALNDPLAVVKM